MLTMVLLFLSGVCHDVLVSKYYVLAQKKSYFLASVVSFLITLLGYLVFAAFLDGLLQGQYGNIVIYSAGCFFGAYAGFKIGNDMPTTPLPIDHYSDADLKHAIELLISECFSAMCIANALGGSRTLPWQLVRENKVEAVFAEAKRRKLPLAGLKMSVGDKCIEDTWAAKYVV